MSQEEYSNVAGIKLRTDKPTNVALHRLFGWVIWQFPLPQKKGYKGAVRPPIGDLAWIPAIIRTDKKLVKIYGNLDKRYATPEKAVQYFQEKGS
jgi:hypothetical protein